MYEPYIAFKTRILCTGETKGSKRFIDSSRLRWYLKAVVRRAKYRSSTFESDGRRILMFSFLEFLRNIFSPSKNPPRLTNNRVEPSTNN